MPRMITIGECMVELGPAGGGQYRRAFAGDTFNMAYYARQALPAGWQVDYLTALGTDRLSDEVVEFMGACGVGTGHVARIPERGVGLYMIHLDRGERSFSYWRSASAARLLAADPAALARGLEGAAVIAHSGITLAILEGEGAGYLTQALAAARDGGALVAFDPNIRPRLWPEAGRMRRVITDGARAASVLLPSLDDEVTHFGDRDAAGTLARYRALGVTRIVLKMGEAGALVAWDGEERMIPAPPAQVVDSTSAGDSFNGTFLAHFAQTGDPFAAAAQAARVAAVVVGHPGALVGPDVLARALPPAA